MVNGHVWKRAIGSSKVCATISLHPKGWYNHWPLKMNCALFEIRRNMAHNGDIFCHSQCQKWLSLFFFCALLKERCSMGIKKGIFRDCYLRCPSILYCKLYSYYQLLILNFSVGTHTFFMEDCSRTARFSGGALAYAFHWHNFPCTASATYCIFILCCFKHKGLSRN